MVLPTGARLFLRKGFPLEEIGANLNVLYREKRRGAIVCTNQTQMPTKGGGPQSMPSTVIPYHIIYVYVIITDIYT